MVNITVQNIFILIATALSPAALAILFHILTKKISGWQKLNFWVQQIIVGLIFAGFTICSFYFGVKYQPMEETGQKIVGSFGSAYASPVIAGLIFGWPSGIIAGFFGAIFRLVLYPFGSGDYLRAAECVGVFVVGLLAALLRKGLFDDKKPKWGYGFVIGILVETFHMLLIFVTGMIQRDVNFAYAVIRQCDIACACVVTAAIVLSLLVISIYEHEQIGIKFNDTKISSKIQRWMFGSFVVAMAAASLLTYFVVSTQASVETHQTLLNAARDIVYELETSPYGSPAGWYVAEHEKGDEGYDDELSQIAYAQRIRTNGYIVVTGVKGLNDGEYDKDAENRSPMPIVKDRIYSIAGDVTDFIDHEFNFITPRGTDFKKDRYDPKLSENTIIKLGLDPASGEHEGESNEFYNNHETSPMFQARVYNGETYFNVVAVRMLARVTGQDNFTETQSFHVDAIMSMYEARMGMGMSFRMSIYVELLVFIAIYGVIYTFIKKAVVTNIRKINTSLEKITEGDLTIKINVRSNEEFASLSDDINHTVDTLKRFIDEAQRRMEQELVFAKSIQHGTLPYIFPNTVNFDLYADMKTAKQVGGDFYDFFPLSNDRLCFLIADVSGKGVPAAMFMMRAETLIKSLVQTDEMSLDRVIAMVNNELCMNNDAQMFVTCWCAILDIKTGHVDFVNAGHNSPILKRKNGKFEEIKVTKNFVLAGLENIPYRLETIDLMPGDEIFLYTDGVTEATDKSLRLFGMERLLKTLNEAHYHTSHEMLDIIMKQLDNFQAGVDQADDITMLMLRYKPEENN